MDENPITPKKTEEKLPIHVYCRIRPSSEVSDPCFIIRPPNKVLFTLENAFHKSGIRQMEFTFKQIFEGTSSQRDVFETVALPLVRNLFEGKDGLLFAYGITGSGKTYTMSGVQSEAGIMPRCLDVIFNSISNLQAKKNVFKPDKMNGFDIMSEVDALDQRKRELKAHLLNSRKRKSPLKKVNSDPDLLNRDPEETSVELVSRDHLYAVFVTFVEIYNNAVYDLLDASSDDPSKGFQAKIVREDGNHNMYVHGVTEIEVSNTEEAYEVYCRGQKRRKIASTVLNAESSRSHSAFTIRLAQVNCNFVGDGMKHEIKVGQLSLVDLAGSERANKTMSTGKRFKEACNINNSLMTLRNCMDILRENYLNGSSKLIPYRESKLTHLFKSFFEGQGQISMIVCVSASAGSADETLHVLKFAETSQEVQIISSASAVKSQDYLARRKRVMEDEMDQPAVVTSKKALFQHPSDDLTSLFSDAPTAESTPTAECIQYFENKLGVYLNRVENNQSIRTIDHIREVLAKQERDWVLVSHENKQLKSNLAAEKSKVGRLEKQIASLEAQLSSLRKKLQESDMNMNNLKKEMIEKEKLLNQKQLEKDKLKQQLNQKFARAEEKFKMEMEKELNKQKVVLEHELRGKENKLAEVKRILGSHGPMSSTPPSSTVESAVEFDFREPRNGTTPRTPASSSSVPERTRARTPISSPTQARTSVSVTNARFPRSTVRKLYPVIKRAGRRSRSAGDVWVDHRPAIAAPLDTVLQPKMPRRKSISKLTNAKDITEGSKYSLMTQNEDEVGDVETRLYKADVIHTSGGGAQVRFNDVEILKQVSPLNTYNKR